MTPRPFYRSRLFWLGLPGLVFLLWGWWLSTGHWSGAGFAEPRAWGLGQIGGEVYGVWDAGGGPEWRNFNGGHRKVGAEDIAVVKRDWAEAEEMGEGFRYVFIPYYWPVLAYTATWLLTLAWWQRHKTRLLKLHTAP